MGRTCVSRGFSLLECLFSTSIASLLVTAMLGLVQVSSLQMSMSADSYEANEVADTLLQDYVRQGYYAVFSPSNPLKTGNYSASIVDNGNPFSTKYSYTVNHYAQGGEQEIVVGVTWNQPIAKGGTVNKSLSVSGWVSP